MPKAPREVVQTLGGSATWGWLRVCLDPSVPRSVIGGPLMLAGSQGASHVVQRDLGAEDSASDLDFYYYQQLQSL